MTATAPSSERPTAPNTGRTLSATGTIPGRRSVLRGTVARPRKHAASEMSVSKVSHMTVLDDRTVGVSAGTVPRKSEPASGDSRFRVGRTGAFGERTADVGLAERLLTRSPFCARAADAALMGGAVRAAVDLLVAGVAEDGTMGTDGWTAGAVWWTTGAGV